MPYRSRETVTHRILNIIGDVFRATVAGTAIYLLGTYGVVSLRADSIDPGTSFIELALKQGGVFGVAILVLFFYRRDWAKLNQYQQDANAVMLKLVQDNTVAMTKLTDVIEGTFKK